MDKVRVIHDKEGESLVIWLDDPQKEVVCEETESEVVLMKDAQGKVIGMEVLHFHPSADANSISYKEF